MTGTEALDLIKMIASVDVFQPLPQDARTQAEKASVWAKMLFDIPFKVAVHTTAVWYSNSKASISISDIREGAANIEHGELPKFDAVLKNIQEATKKYYIGDRSSMTEALAMLTEFEKEIVHNQGGLLLLNTNGINDFAVKKMADTYKSMIVARKQQRQTPAKYLDTTGLKKLMTKSKLEIEGG